MKKVIFLIFLVILLFGTISCKPKSDFPKENPIKVVSANISTHNTNISYPQIDYKKIDDFISQEITILVNNLKKNFQLEQIDINYHYFIEGKFISFVFNIYLQTQSEENILYYRCYNFDYKTSEQLIITNEQLQSYFLNLINKSLKNQGIQYSFYDCLGLSYIIQNDKVYFLIPELSKNSDYYLLEFENNNYLADEISPPKIDENFKKVVLTFDDGPSSSTPMLISLLQKHKVKATFFVLGSQVERYPNYLQLLSKNNYEIGNHSYSHSDFSKLTIEEIVFEIKTTQEIVYKNIGIYPKIFRFPYGSFRNETLEYIKLPVILWNVDSNDWRRPGRDIIKNNIFMNLVDESIILFHDNALLDVDLIEEVITGLLEENYQFISIFELYNFKNQENMISGKIYR